MTHIIPSHTFEGVFLISSDIYEDNRWNFSVLYHESVFRELWIENDFVQDNLSLSKKWTLRGLHFQKNHPQAKLIFPISWSIYDVMVDIRKESPTFWKYEGYILESGKWVFVPKGFAHGFLALSDDTKVMYKCDTYYDPHDEGGIIWEDRELSIPWKGIMDSYYIKEIILSEKDRKLQNFNHYRNTI